MCRDRAVTGDHSVQSASFRTDTSNIDHFPASWLLHWASCLSAMAPYGCTGITYKTGMVFVSWWLMDLIFLPQIINGQCYIYTCGNWISSHFSTSDEQKVDMGYMRWEIWGAIPGVCRKEYGNRLAMSVLVEGTWVISHDCLFLILDTLQQGWTVPHLNSKLAWSQPPPPHPIYQISGEI